jgi:hypothetical protein
MHTGVSVGARHIIQGHFGKGHVELSVHVDDAKIRADRPGFDGLESVFALVPRDSANGVIWEKTAIPFRSNFKNYGLDMDDHVLFLEDSKFDLKAIKKHGIAFGMDTNVGTIWMQSWGKNAPLIEETIAR